MPADLGDAEVKAAEAAIERTSTAPALDADAIPPVPEVEAPPLPDPVPEVEAASIPEVNASAGLGVTAQEGNGAAATADIADTDPLGHPQP